MSKFVFSFVLLSLCVMNVTSFPSVRVEQGLLRGSYMRTTRGRQFYAFRGIPYAKPPLGELRFKAPLPAGKWNGTYDATEDTSICPQVTTSGAQQGYQGDEDCLTLTVYTHSTKTRKRFGGQLPVVVYIHGGGFTHGSVQSTEYPPERIMNQPIIFILPQYRLSALGFLSTADECAPGNYGLLDQALALQWVQKNIARFGGDPQRVTLAGVSAGGASVGFHLVSPKSRGLFRAAVLQSGPVLANVAVQTDPLPQVRRLGLMLNCSSNETEVLLECLRNVSAERIIAAALVLPGVAAPVVENPEYGQFMFETPTKLITEGRFTKVPTMIGTVYDEGASSVITSGLLQQIELAPEITDAMLGIVFNWIVPAFIQIGTGYNTNMANLSLAVREEYGKIYDFYDKKQLTKFLIDIIGDTLFISPSAKLASLLAAQNVTTYLYSFEYAGNLSALSYFGEKAVDHGDDVRYLLFPNQTKEDSKYSDQFGTMLSNFAHYLNPTPKNKPVKWLPTPPVERLLYLKFGNESIVTEAGYFTERVAFWNEIAPSIVGNGSSKAVFTNTSLGLNTL